MTDSTPAAELLRHTASQVPWLRKLADDPRRESEPGKNLTDADWLRARVADTARRWDCDEIETNATLWWYAATYRLIGTAVTTALVTGKAVAWDPGDEIWLRPNGYFGGFTPQRWVEPEQCGTVLAETLGPVIAVMSELGGVDPAALWRLCADAVASRCLTAAPATGSIAHCSTFARQVIASMSPDPTSPDPTMSRYGALAPPQFADQDESGVSIRVRAEDEPAAGSERTVLRTECCKLHHTPNHGRCRRCPKRRRQL